MALPKRQISLPTGPTYYIQRFWAVFLHIESFGEAQRGRALVPIGPQLAEAANEPCFCLRQQVARRPTQGTDGAPGLGRLQPDLGLRVLSVGPGERWNPHELVAGKIEQALDQDELQELTHDERRSADQYLAGCGEVGCQWLDRLQDDDRDGEQCQRGVRW